MWGVPLVCLFHNPILVSIVAPLELGLGIHNPRFVAGPLEVELGTRNPRFVAWPLELGLGTRSPRFVAWPFELGLGIRNARSTVFALHCFVLPCVPIEMQGVGLLDFTLGYSTIVYLTFLFLTLPCPVLTYRQIPEMLPSDDDDSLADGLEGPHPPPSPSATPNPAPCDKEGGQCVPLISINCLIGAVDKVWQPRTLCGLFMCTICRLVQRLLYIKDVSLPCMTLRSLLHGPQIRTTQRLPPQRSTRTKKQHGQLSTKPSADRLTCIFFRVFGKWMTEADILELSR